MHFWKNVSSFRKKDKNVIELEINGNRLTQPREDAEAFAAYFNLLKTKRNLLYIRNQSVNTFHHGYKNQSVNDVYSKSRCLF